MPRLFVGLEIPREVAQALSLLRGGLSGARWIDPENYHLTLRFAGDVDGNGTLHMPQVAIYRGDSTVHVESDSLSKASAAPSAASAAPAATRAVTTPAAATATPAAPTTPSAGSTPKPAGTAPATATSVAPPASAAPRVAAAQVATTKPAASPAVASRAPVKAAPADPHRAGATADSAQGRNASGVLRAGPRIHPTKGKIRSDTSRTPENPFRLPPAGGPA